MNKYEEILKGDTVSFDCLYRKYHPIVYKFQKKYYLRDFDREDWLQEGRIIFYRSLEKYDEVHNVSIGQFFKSNFENHIRSLVRRQCAVKRTIDVQSISLDQKIENQGESFFDYIETEDADVLEQMIIREKLEQLPTVLSSFERVTFQEYMNGKELKEIAKDTDSREITVRSAYDRAKKKLKGIIYD
ncbi:RNA polymerase subunit sigma-30 [Enterococcus ureilyticus]|uniref:RNA polymerase subunit sigma-30 n=1 Tax=Enterococcus ureilyticus TaxID=1131292 RepID=A0A1E5HEC6_9ENTE|nr:sigma-70 family RNA polymerase sigma factor [Enterococcus ureilyticus]MBM7689895.1 RNA polymerase sporulation-specific sigma factor [Enterococcus ureilyticus]MBO0446556.1 sigma-70 family RNA polymerase sigma factor [Enterococcus ureilyticus]OEG23155.1 RNA polymerase subunit sigma-30 [Enterococcus ureilyticus]